MVGDVESRTADDLASVLVFVAAIAGIANTLMMSTFERMHEFGMLLSLGCRPLRIVALIVLEACLVAGFAIIESRYKQTTMISATASAST